MSQIQESRDREFGIFGLYHLGLSTLIAILLFPILGMYVALFMGYFFFSSLLRRWNGKLAVLTGLVFFLVASSIHILDSPYIAEELGNAAYFFFLIGTVQEVITVIRLNRNSSLVVVK